MVGRLFSFLEGLFSGAFAVSFGEGTLTLPPQHAGIRFTQCRAYRFPVDPMASVESGRMARTHPEGSVAPGDVV